MADSDAGKISNQPPHPWDINEHGLWCPACGNHIAAPWNLTEEGYWPPSDCPKCGWPDFEDGTGYFADEGTP